MCVWVGGGRGAERGNEKQNGRGADGEGSRVREEHTEKWTEGETGE